MLQPVDPAIVVGPDRKLQPGVLELTGPALRAQALVGAQDFAVDLGQAPDVAAHAPTFPTVTDTTSGQRVTFRR